MKTNTENNGLVVVGVDSSEGAKAALRFALDEARLRQATLRIVHTWQYGYIGVKGIEGFRRLRAPISASCGAWLRPHSTRLCTRSRPTATAS